MLHSVQTIAVRKLLHLPEKMLQGLNKGVLQGQKSQFKTKLKSKIIRLKNKIIKYTANLSALFPAGGSFFYLSVSTQQIMPVVQFFHLLVHPASHT